MVTNQAYLFIIFIANGFFIGLLFDFFRILRKVIKTSDFITYIEDILFCILTGSTLLYSIFVFNNGEIRLFMFLAIIIGIATYIIFLSSYVIKVNVTIINIFKNIVLKIFAILIFPLKVIHKFAKKILFKPISFIIINVRRNSTKLFTNIIQRLKSNKKIKNTVKN